MLTEAGEIETMNSPSPKKEVKINPIIVSSFRPVRWFKNNIVPAARPPATKAPNANGRPNMYAPATPGTIEWLNASPISDQPLSIRYTDKNAQIAPTNELTHIALNI